MIVIEPKFEKGDNVRVITTGEVGTVNEVISGKRSIGYHVTVNGNQSVYPEKYLELHIDKEKKIIENVVLNDYGGLRDFQLFNTWIRHKKPIEGNYFSYLSSKTLFNPYQFKPLSKFLSHNSNERLFIADEVGVGKTIETGIILTELIARGRISRRDPVLIVCPNSLGPKWVKEMKERFNLDFTFQDGKSLRNLLLGALNGKLPSKDLFSVVSIQLLRNEKYLKLIEEINARRESTAWAMVIVDEAHHMRNKNTESNRLGHLLSGLTEMMTMLSATPLNLRDTDLFNLMNILNPSLYPDQYSFELLLEPVKTVNKIKRLIVENNPVNFTSILKLLKHLESTPLRDAFKNNSSIIELTHQLKKRKKLTYNQIALHERILTAINPLDSSFTRTLKREAFQKKTIREVIKLPVQLTDKEKQFHDDVISFTEELFLNAGGSESTLGFFSNMPRRMASSCIPAMKEYLRHSLENNLSFNEDFDSYIDDEDFEDVDFEWFEEDSNIEQQELQPAMRIKYQDLLSRAEEIGDVDSKYNTFKGFIDKMLNELDNPQIVVFSFFISTLNYLKKRLENDGYKVDLISGKIPLESVNGYRGRYEVIEDFKLKKFNILLSSDVGGEGLDFQFCQAILNYDMPYNPMKVEQRIGRIDRFGQKAEKIFAASMYLKDTVDERIYELLYERINLVQDSIGFIEPIINKNILSLQKDLINGALSEEQINERAKTLELSLHQSRLEQEKFEVQKNHLLGESEFNQLINGLQVKNDFLKPSDALNLSKMFLTNYPSCVIKVLDSSKAIISLSYDLKTKLEQYSRLPGSEGCMNEFKSLLGNYNEINVIFDGSEAVENAEFVFLPPSGFWIKFILKELEENNLISNFFSLSCNSSEISLDKSVYVIPSFEVQVEGIKSDIYLTSVPINIETEEPVNNIDFTKFSRTLSQIKGSDFDHSIELFNISKLINIARFCLQDFMENKLNTIRAESEVISSLRIESIRKGSESRIALLQDRISSHELNSRTHGKNLSQEYIRLVQAQISNEAKRTEAKIMKLQDNANVSFKINLASVTLLNVY
nr:DEAD/DEAH box helicase [Neobacillus sp. Marseille-Q6967]